MRVPSSQDQEALDALFRKARTEPSAEHVHRVKQRLHALAREVETPRGRSGTGALVACLAVVSLGLLLGPRESVVAYGGGPSGPAVAAATAESPKISAVHDAVPVEDLAPADEAPRAEPARVVASDENAAPRDRRPALARVPQPAKTVVAERPADVSGSPEAPSTPSQTDEPAQGTPPALEASRKEGEASFLRRAKVALASDPALALRLTDEHPTVYPRGVLLQEREIIAIEALIRLGRAQDARARAASFRSRYPSSAYHGHLDDQIERLLAGSTNDARR